MEIDTLQTNGIGRDMKYSYRCGHERQKNHHREQKYKVQSVEKAKSNERKSGWKKSRTKYSVGKYREICTNVEALDMKTPNVTPNDGH